MSPDAERILSIVGQWVEDWNNGHGLDTGDLVWNLEQAGFLLPESEEDL